MRRSMRPGPAFPARAWSIGSSSLEPTSQAASAGRIVSPAVRGWRSDGEAHSRRAHDRAVRRAQVVRARAWPFAQLLNSKASEDSNNSTPSKTGRGRTTSWCWGWGGASRMTTGQGRCVASDASRVCEFLPFVRISSILCMYGSVPVSGSYRREECEKAKRRAMQYDSMRVACVLRKLVVSGLSRSRVCATSMVRLKNGKRR